jgi:diguanylate cyclase (GGDEF)-like protein
MAVLNGLPAILLTFDASLRVLFSSERLLSLLGRSREPVRNRALHTLFGSDGPFPLPARRQLLSLCRDAVAGRAVEPVLFTAEASPAGTPAPKDLVATVSAIAPDQWMLSVTETVDTGSVEARAIELASRDALTGVFSRQSFQERLFQALSPGPCAVVMLDVDRFKAVNDTLGHPIGDALLRLVASRLSTVAKREDSVARLGGDEFALLVTGSIDAAEMAALAARITELIGRVYMIDGHLINVGASVGIAVAPQHGRDHEELLKNADLALYHAKNAGRGTWSFFDPTMKQRALARRSLEIDMRKALALHEFELHYQPQLDLDTKRVAAFEALLRWRHPERGLVSPADFIPLAEEIGLIVAIGEWALRRACREAATWPDDVSVAVNVSPRQFEDPDLCDKVAAALSDAGLPGSRLEIEVTESVLLQNDRAVLEALHALHDMGVRIAMDDFGTGYSSLSQLNSFPFDKIKIDRSFISQHREGSSQAAIIRTITALGTSLGMSTIAEGVETADQLARIQAEGCQSVQGFLFSRPVPAPEVGALLRRFKNGW